MSDAAGLLALIKWGIIGPNQPLQPTAAAILVLRSSTSLNAAAAAELIRSAAILLTNGGSMRFLSPMIMALTFLVVCIGPGPAQNDDEADKKKRRAEIQKEIQELQVRIAKLSAELAKLLTIIEIPRPNSKTYTMEEATTLLPKTIARSRAIDSQNPLVAEWKNPTHGFRVHVKANNDIETVNFFGDKQSGMAGLKSALQLSEAMQFGNPLSVLLTSETDGWQTDTKQQILEMLFRPSIQLYIVTDK